MLFELIDFIAILFVPSREVTLQKVCNDGYQSCLTARWSQVCFPGREEFAPSTNNTRDSLAPDLEMFYGDHCSLWTAPVALKDGLNAEETFNLTLCNDQLRP